MATSLKTQLASKGVKILLKNKTTGESMKFNFPQNVTTIPLHMTIDSYSLYGNAHLVEVPQARVGDPDLQLELRFSVPKMGSALEPVVAEEPAPTPKAEEPAPAPTPKSEEPPIATDLPVEVPTSANTWSNKKGKHNR